MSINSAGQNINVNGNLILGSGKKVRSTKFEFTTDGISLEYSTGKIATTSNLEASYLSGNGKNVTHTTDASAGTYGGSVNLGTGSITVPIISVDSAGRIDYIGEASSGASTLQAVTSTGANTTVTMTLENSTSLLTEGQVAVANTSPTADVDFTVGESLIVKDGASETLETTGGIKATHFIGDASNLTSVSDLTSTSHGTNTKVPRITFDANGRISGITETDILSNVSSATTNQLAVYTDINTVGGSSAATFNPTNGNMEITGTFTAGGNLVVTGDLRVNGSTTVTQNVLIEDPIMEIGNVAAADSTLGTVLSRADGNVAVGVYLSNDHVSANTLVFGPTTSSGASSTVVIDGTKQIDSKFYGNVETTNYFLGDGSKLTSIDFSAVDNNAETRLAAVEADLTSNVSRIATLESDLDTAETNITNLQSAVTDERSNVNTLQADLTSNVSRIATAEGNITTLQADLTSNVSKITTLQSDLDTAETNITNLQTDLTSNVSRIATLETNLSANVTRIDNNFTVLNSSITTVNSNVEALKTKTDGLTLSGGTYTFDGNVVATSNITSTNVNGNLFASSITLGDEATISVSSLTLQDICEVGNTFDATMTVGTLNATNLSVSGTKNFDIAHPLDASKRLVHACIETARADDVYMGEVVLKDGQAVVDLDLENGMTPGTFVALHKNIRVFTTNESDWDAVKGSVDGALLKVFSQNTDSQAKVSWLVAGTRTDIADLVVEP